MCRQQTSGTGATALDEVLHRVAAPEHLVQVLREHRGVYRIAGELAAHEKRAAATQDAADEGQVEVVAGGDMGKHEPPVEQDVGQHEIVDVRPVARRVDQRMGSGKPLEVLDACDAHALVDPVPEPGEQSIEEANDRIGHVRCDPVGGFSRGTLHARSWCTGGHRVPDCRRDLGARENLCDQGAPVR